MIRHDIKAALVAAMKGGDKQSTAAIRLIQAAIKNRRPMTTCWCRRCCRKW